MNWKRAAAVSLLLVVLSAILTATQRDLFVGDETKYGEIVREMRASHSIFVPILNGEPYSHKPPIHFWMIYALTGLIGAHSIWPFVLPSILAVILLFLICRVLGRELFGPETGDCAAFLLSCSYLVWSLTQTGRMDVLFVALISLGMLFLWKSYDRPSMIIVTGLIVGIASLVKGPMAQVLTILMFAASSIAFRRRPRWHDAIGLLVALLTPLLWLVPATLQRGESYLQELLVKQSLGRAVHAWVHREPVWFYLGRYPASFFPWFATLPFAIAFIFRNREDTARKARLFCLLWILVVMGAFSALSSKLDIYMLPAIPAAALLLASFVVQFPGLESRAALTATRCVTALLLIAGLAGIFAAPLLLHSPEGGLFPIFRVRALCLIMAIVAGVALLWSVRRPALDVAVTGLGFAALTPLFLLAALLTPSLNRVASSTTLVEALSRQEGDGKRIALYQCPFLWSRTLPESYDDVHYIGRNGLQEWAGPLPRIVAVRAGREGEVPLLPQRYVRVDRVRMIGKDFDVYRLR
ncbi:MAG TPA: glycosyltransferase family 39 protein [Thermoanaerobaculia bacterium]|nr:glycosyltransferase family 39 protein [Thermoanaerobaculia bacterium]